jgi:hypothetical protein
MDVGRERRIRGSVRTGAFAAIALLLATSRGFAAGGDLLWRDVLDSGAGADTAHHVTIADGRVFAAGLVATPGAADAVVRAYDAASGAVLWSDQRDGAGGVDSVFWTAEDGGRLFTAGFASADPSCRWFTTGACDLAVAAYDAGTGTLLWEDLSDLAGGPDVAFAVAAADGRVFAAGAATTATGDTALWVRAYDAATGELLWEDLLDTPGGDDQALSVAVQGNSVAVAGVVAGDASCDVEAGSGNCDFAVRVYDAAAGALAWEDRLDGSGFYDFASSIAVRGQEVLVGGGVGTDAACSPRTLSGDCDLLLRTYDVRSGALDWQVQRDAAGGFDSVFAVAVGAGVFLAAGASESAGTGLDFLVQAYDVRSGALRWEDRVDGAGGDEWATSLVARGPIAVAGGWISGNGGDLEVRAYDAADGSLRWEDRHDAAGGTDFAYGVALGSGRVASAGLLSDAGGDVDFEVRTYEQ